MKAWKTKPTLDRRSLVSLFSDSRARSCPASRTVPEVGRSKPAAQCSSVLLPDPDGPITAVNECRANSALTPSSARTAFWPCRYSLLTSRNATGTAGWPPPPDSSRSRPVNGSSIVISFLPVRAYRPSWHALCMLPCPPARAEGAGGQAGEGFPSVQALRPLRTLRT